MLSRSYHFRGLQFSFISLGIYIHLFSNVQSIGIPKKKKLGLIYLFSAFKLWHSTSIDVHLSYCRILEISFMKVVIFVFKNYIIVFPEIEELQILYLNIKVFNSLLYKPFWMKIFSAIINIHFSLKLTFQKIAWERKVLIHYNCRHWARNNNNKFHSWISTIILIFIFNILKFIFLKQNFSASHFYLTCKK